MIFSPALDAKMIYVHQPASRGRAAFDEDRRRQPAGDEEQPAHDRRSRLRDDSCEPAKVEGRCRSRQAGRRGPAEYKGLEKTAGVEQACHHFVRRTPSGEIWNIYLDPRSMLPRLVVAENKQGDLLERYVYSEIRENPTELAAAAAFSPSERWGEGKGLFLATRQGGLRRERAKQQRTDDALTAKSDGSQPRMWRRIISPDAESRKNVTIDLEMGCLVRVQMDGS